jgi:hypothetical protein
MRAGADMPVAAVVKQEIEINAADATMASQSLKRQLDSLADHGGGDAKRVKVEQDPLASLDMDLLVQNALADIGDLAGVASDGVAEDVVEESRRQELTKPGLGAESYDSIRIHTLPALGIVVGPSQGFLWRR